MSEFSALNTTVSDIKADEVPAPSIPDSAVEVTATPVEANAVPAEKLSTEEKNNADLAVVTSMLSQMGEANIAPVVIEETNSSVKEELRLLPFESHTSDLMFTDPSFNMYIYISCLQVCCNVIVIIALRQY